MKFKKLNKKLFLKKTTIAALNRESTAKVLGGAFPLTTFFRCPTATCPEKCTTVGSVPPECETYDCTLEPCCI